MLSRYEQFSSMISTICRCVQKIERDEMVKYGYKGSYAQYLVAISHYPDGITARRLCETCDKDKAAISRVIAEMEESGLVERVGEGTSKYRARLFLTDKGRKLADVVSERARVAVDLVGEGLTDYDRSIFYATLDRIAANLQKVGKEGIPAENRGE